MKLHKGFMYLGSFMLLGALAMPISMQAQDDHHDHDKEHRVYDREHKDYHVWNADEDRSYRQWYTDNHHGKAYREFNKLNRKDQSAYWAWRHEHGGH
ncbi:MAG TPA: hypothetical protein VGK22_17080 [Candidatus Angelobacter sp.]|jgi:hypothetical protein